MTEIRLMTELDIPDVLSVWKEVKLSLGTHTIETFYDLDSDGFYVAVEDGTIVGACASVVHNENFATIGLYAVRPSHQGKGIGKKLWKMAMNHVGERNCFLSAMPEHYHTYKDKAGFTFVDTCNTVIWENNAVTMGQIHQEINGVSVRPLNHEMLESVIAYDEHVVGYNRATVIKNIAHENDCIFLAATRNESICGYGCIEDNILGGKLLGPLYADAPDIAEIILYRLLLTSSSEQCALTYMGIDTNPFCTELAQKLGLEKSCTLPRLYTKAVLQGKFEKVYSQMDLDFCNI